jgi:photosystem II stability/assembly factor-like uncharacterized protein
VGKFNHAGKKKSKTSWGERVKEYRRVVTISMLIVLLALFSTLESAQAAEYEWQVVESPSGILSLHDICALSSTNVWVVGERFKDLESEGIILRWDGLSWTEVPCPTNNKLFGVFMLSSDEGWAVGEQGTILFWDGSSWTQVPSPTDKWLSDVFMLSSDEGWAVGEQGTILFWDGLSWTQVPSPIAEKWISFNTVFMISSDDGWIGSGVGIFRWNGTTWTRVSPNWGSTGSIYMISENDGWATIDLAGKILRWDGSSWQLISIEDVGTYIFSIYMLSSDDGWAVGEEGLILHWDDNRWLRHRSPVNEDLYKVFMLSPEEGWIIGYKNLLKYGPLEAPVGFEKTPILVIVAGIVGLSLSAFFIYRKPNFSHFLHNDFAVGR